MTTVSRICPNTKCDKRQILRKVAGMNKAALREENDDLRIVKRALAADLEQSKANQVRLLHIIHGLLSQVKITEGVEGEIVFEGVPDGVRAELTERITVANAAKPDGPLDRLEIGAILWNVLGDYGAMLEAPDDVKKETSE